MSDFYKRQIQLWGDERQKSLDKKTILIVGCGGLGCSLGIALGSSGIGNIHLVDFDTITSHNIHRQIAFRLEDEGKYKAKVLHEVISSRVEDKKIHSHTCSFEDFIKKDIQVDLILDATDNLFVRDKIDKYAKSINKPWIYASVEEFNGQVCFFENSNFSDIFKIKEAKPAGQIAPMVMQIASFSASFALRYLVGLEVMKDRLYYLSWDKNGEFKSKSFKLKV